MRLSPAGLWARGPGVHGEANPQVKADMAADRQTLDEGAKMLPSVRPVRRAIKGAIGTGALAGAVLFGAAAIATAQPEPAVPVPPACTAAELARVMSGVTFDTSNYLTLNPAVNDFFTSLKGQPRDQISAQVQTYLDANPGVRDELQTIRQPSVDFRQRCGAPAPTP
jgi:hemophore-related protein